MSAALDLPARVPSVLVFLAALAVVSECCSATGVFDVLSRRLVRWARGRVDLTWGLMTLASCVVTAFLSLDTTAVLMTSAGVAVARRLRVPVAVFAYPTLWIATMASMWLPVSNLTTLLARDVLPHPDTVSYLAASWPIALTTTVVPLVCSAVMFRRHLRGTVTLEPDDRLDGRDETPADDDLTLARRVVTTIVGLMSLAILVVEPAVAATVAAVACWVAVAFLAPARRTSIRIPWSSLGITAALFVVVAALHGLHAVDAVTNGLGSRPEWQLTLAAAAGANVVNNLPAYLALEPAAHGETTRVLALLVGVNVASGLTWWGSVATLLWRDRLRRLGEPPRLTEHLVRTGVVTLVTSGAALGLLELLDAR